MNKRKSVLNCSSTKEHFHLNGYVNKRNFRIWANENQRVIVETPMRPNLVTVKSKFLAGGIIGIFKNYVANSVTVNREHESAMSNSLILIILKDHDRWHVFSIRWRHMSHSSYNYGFPAGKDSLAHQDLVI